MSARKTWLSTLKKKLGEHLVSTEDSTLEQYATDYTEAEPSKPAAVVYAHSAEHVKTVLETANQHRVPVTPIVAGTNVGGLALPAPGGIVLDLKGMNRIVELNRSEMYVVLEPGVTFGQLKEYLQQHAPDLTIAYPLAPPNVSIMANCLLDGLGNLSFMHGSMGEWIGGLEVMLPSGKVVRTGAAALSKYWFARAPLPDLTGLFLNWQGTTGIVTKLSVQLWPEPTARKRLFAFTYSVEEGFQILRSLARRFIFFDLGGLTWPAGKMLFGVDNPLVRDPSEPEFFLYADIGGFSKGDLNERLKIYNRVLKDFRKSGVEVEGPVDVDEIVKAVPDFASLADFPMTLEFLLEKGGLTWIGTYGPSSLWENGVRRGSEIMLAHGIAPTVVTRPMKGGHYGVLRFITVFDKKNEDEKTRARKVNEELLELVLELGFVPYKMPPWAWARIKNRIDPGFLELLYKLKELLDPNAILNPGKSGTAGP